ncbi:MAG: tRNA adenosine(34) deaminase TadA [Panacagrimonas sp.]
MRRALQLAHQAEAEDEVPVGAVLVTDGQVIGEGRNRPIASSDPCAHAELLAIRQACAKVGNYRIPGSTLYVTLEPCTMCAGVIIHARVQRLIFGAYDPKAGAVTSVYDIIANPRLNHRVAWEGGIMQAECAQMLRQFFKRKRTK